MTELREVSWRPAGVVVLDRFSLSLEERRITAILGRSGCGKSSLLRVLAGLRALDGGEVERGATRLSFVFQDPALLPWRTVRENVSLPGEFGRVADIERALTQVGLAEQAHKLPAALSGGQRMRASLARALVSRPELLLLDEPFGALDVATRAEMTELVLRAHAELGCTIVLVTHDLADAARLADRVVVVDGPPLRVVRNVQIEAPRPRSAADVAALVQEVEP
ncbi:aliphatic sulfonates import ATP-binding protein SsuB [Deltaproteobacteria bacterium]|nr:aliphatic sulfonates import ATP-binding protein SsuB [Deltaproteobacteria bacterium]